MSQPLSIVLPASQRWRNGRDSYRPAREPIRTQDYFVEPLPDDRRARAFVEQHHYSHSYPAARARFGLLRWRRHFAPELVGVAVFSQPMSQGVVPRYTGVSPQAGVELGRLVLLDEVEANGESWFVARALRQLREVLPQVQTVVSYSDPVPRTRMDGSIYFPGHIGCVYAALNARFCGRSHARAMWVARNGMVVSPRALSKIRNEERGIDYAMRQLVTLGAPPRQRGEPPRLYVERALREGGFRRVWHKGNYVYTFALGSARQRRALRQRFAPALPYPKDVDPVPGGAAVVAMVAG